MNNIIMATNLTSSLWYENYHQANYPILQNDLTTEVCVIGAGIAGITTAYRLICEGKSVVLLEGRQVGSGETGRTTAHLANAVDDHYFQIEKFHGYERAKIVARSHTAAINFIENIIVNEKIDCDFRRLDGYLFSGKNTTNKNLYNELQAAKRSGLSHVELVTKPPENTFDMGLALRFPEQGQFHPMKYLDQLAKIITQKGGQIYENTYVNSIESNSRIKIKTNAGFIVTAEDVVTATNVPLNNKLKMLLKLEPNRTYVIGALIPKNSLKYALYWDLDEPYHYVRLQPYDMENDILIIGGEDHRVGINPLVIKNPFDKLERWARENFPQMSTVQYRWSGQILEPIDYTAYIGHLPANKRIYTVTGDSGNGMTHGTIAGILIPDLILKRNNYWSQFYDPARKNMKSWLNFTKHNYATLISYLNYIPLINTKAVSKILLEDGAILQCGLKKITTYRDKNNKLVNCSAICSHLGSIVNWNPTERSWDCPAHGSRFNVDGKVINGPANKPLNSQAIKDGNFID